MLAEPAIEIREVSFAFPPQDSGALVPVLNRVSFNVAAGEFVCVLGPSGCGKTTLLYLVAGLLSPQSGTLRVLPGKEHPRAVVPCTLLFQDLNLFYWMTALQNVEVPLRARGLAPRERAEGALKCLDQVHLADFADYYPHELSGGMRQRVAIARAIATDAPTLLLDEPFSNLDRVTTEGIQRDLLQLREQNALTILMITHEVEEAVRMADRVVVLSGRPATVRCIIPIEQPHPRQATIRTLPTFKRIEELVLCETQST